jgi:diguanylate cyclase (GGDEF)-like protein
MRARGGSDDEVGFRLATVRTGAWVSVGFALTYLVYFLLTWGEPNRDVLMLLVGSVPPASLLLGLFPPRRLIAGRFREVFFLSWSASITTVVGGAAALDGGAASPLMIAFFLPLAFAALSYPLPSMIAVGAMVIAGYTLLALTAGGVGFPVVLFTDSALLFAAGICAGQAANHHASRRRIAELSRLDALTGCLNRRGVEEAVEPALQGLADGSADLSLIVVDLDGFKEVNDAHGHAAGDELIRITAHRLQSVLRPGDLVARMGGDEFAIVLTGESAGPRGATAVAERVLTAMREPVVVDGHELLLVGSAGIVHGERGQALSELLSDADAAMYRAKEEPGFWVEFVPEMRGDSGARMTLLGELRAALGTGQLVLHYQPIIELQTGTAIAAEALVRWERPGHGLLPPGDFIELAEQSGLIVPLGREVLERACQQAREWQGVPGAPQRVSVNVSARQLIDPGFVASVEQALQTADLPPRRLVLEITETAFMRDPDAAAARLEELRALGVRAALDDFGTGYSSLSYLRDLPVDFLKVARPFVAQMERGESDLALVRSIVELGRGLGMGVVAEGIETAAQAEALRELSCDYGQGFHLGRPQAPLAGRASVAGSGNTLAGDRRSEAVSGVGADARPSATRA